MKKCIRFGVWQIITAVAIDGTGFAQQNARVPSDQRLGDDIVTLLREEPDLSVASVGKHGTVTAVSGALGRSANRGKQIGAVDTAPALARVAKLFRVKPADLRHDRTKVDELGFAHTRFQQTKYGVDVVGGVLSLHANADGFVYAAFGNCRDGENLPPPTLAKLGQGAAKTQALKHRSGGVKAGPARIVYVITSIEQEMHLAWEVRVFGRGDFGAVDELVYVDAATGNVIDVHPLVFQFANRETWRYMPQSGGTPFRLYQTEGGSPQFSDSAAEDNWRRLGYSHDFFELRGRNSYDGSGCREYAYMSVPGEVNASWHLNPDLAFAVPNGNAIWFGPAGTDSFGVEWGDWASDPDVVYHEFAHGITYYSSGLIYRGESGGLNESFSDITAAAITATRTGTVDARTWAMCEIVATPSIAGDAARYMDDPARPGAQGGGQPSLDYYDETFNPATDVHYISGIANLAFKLLVTGGTHPRGKSAINVPFVGMDYATRIFYRAFTVYLNPNSQLIDARAATVRAAQDLGLAVTTNVELAWDAVGVRFVEGNNHPMNMSTRAQVGSGNDLLVSGFVLSGGSPKAMLVRGIGPTLQSQGVSGWLADPLLRLFDAGGTERYRNDNWGIQSAGLPSATQVAQTASSLGAFALPSSSLDSAMLPTLDARVYTIQVTGSSGGTGEAMTEIYDTDTANPNHLLNLSSRAKVSSGHPIISGFVIVGGAHKRILLRAVGPSLANVGIGSGFLPNPTLTLFHNGTAIRSNDDWGIGGQSDPGIQAASVLAGAFPLNGGSTDAAILIQLPPGIYTAHANTADGSSGLCLLELYEVNGSLPR